MNDDVSKLFKFADDMALVGLLTNEASLSTYYFSVERLTEWCQTSYLELNVKKTKELLFKNNVEIDFEPVKIGGENVETVENFKYLGTVIDNQLNFSENVNLIYKKSQQRLYLLRKLRSFGVNKLILETVYRSLIESILSYNIACWYGFLSAKDKNKLGRIVHLAEKIIGNQQANLTCVYKQSVKRKALKVVACESHPLFGEFSLLPSGRRYRVPLAKKRFKKSFIPSAIEILNGKM